MYIITFTYAHDRFAAAQKRLSAPARHAQPTTAGCRPRDLQNERVLRRRRSVAGEVRDASAGRGGESADQRGREGLRILPAIVLPGSGCVSGCRARRSAAAETRPAIRSQAHARPDELHRPAPRSRAGHFQCSTGRSDYTPFWRIHSPTQHRPATPASKKTPVNTPPAAVSFADRQLVTAYEELRSQAVKGWRRGPGLFLMLTRGFRCWMEAARQLLDTASITHLPVRRSEHRVTADVRNEIVTALASMLLHRASKVMV